MLQASDETTKLDVPSCNSPTPKSRCEMDQKKMLEMNSTHMDKGHNSITENDSNDLLNVSDLFNKDRLDDDIETRNGGCDLDEILVQDDTYINEDIRDDDGNMELYEDSTRSDEEGSYEEQITSRDNQPNSSYGRTKKSFHMTNESSSKDDLIKDNDANSSKDEVPCASTELVTPGEQKNVITEIETTEIGHSANLDNDLNIRHEPDEDDLNDAVDLFFSQIANEDKESVTVGDIVRSIQEMYGTKLRKASRKKVRERLTHLILDETKKCSSKRRTKTKSRNSHHKTSIKKKTSDEAEVASSRARKIKKHGKSITHKVKNEVDFDEMEPSEGENSDSSFDAKSKRFLRRSIKKQRAPSHVRIHHEMMRKKQLAESKVREEELRFENEEKISKEDKERAEQIALRFETDGVEERKKRVEDRMSLLDLLDEKKIALIKQYDFEEDLNDEKGEQNHSSLVSGEECLNRVSNNLKDTDDFDGSKDGNGQTVEKYTSCSESDDSDDELVILEPIKVSTVSTPANSSITNSCKSPSPKSVLDFFDSVTEKSSCKTKTKQKGPMNGTITNSRKALRNRLRAKQCEAGNKWLANALGYKDEEDHIRSCEIAEIEKRKKALQLEEERCKTERNRRRSFFFSSTGDKDVSEKESEDAQGEEKFDSLSKRRSFVDREVYMPGKESEGLQEEDEDEEIAMAREIENEQSESVLNKENEDEQRMNEINGREPNNRKFAKGESYTSGEESERQEDEVEENYLAKARKIESENDGSMLNKESEDAQKVKVTDKFDLNQRISDGGNVYSSKESDGREEENEIIREREDEKNGAILRRINDSSETNKSSLDIIGSQIIDDTLNSSQFQDNSNGPVQTPTSTSLSKKVSNQSLGKEAAIESSEEETSSNGTKYDDVNENKKKELEQIEKDCTSNEESHGNGKPRNMAWKKMLEKEASMLKKRKSRKGGMIDAEAEEEEEEEGIAGLEDFGFTSKEKKNRDKDEDMDVDIDDDDLDHIVDDISDNEGDEEAGERARKAMAAKEEKERHKEIIRRMREGYDGRRGGVAGGIGGARGNLRFNELVAADNREHAKSLGLANDDELLSDDEKGADEVENSGEVEDESALIDKYIKDRHLKREEQLDEIFSDDDGGDDDNEEGKVEDTQDEEDLKQDRLAKRFTKRARMNRLLNIHAKDSEFSYSSLLEENEILRNELKSIKNVHNIRKRQVSASSSINIGSFLDEDSSRQSGSENHAKRQKNDESFFVKSQNRLSIALTASRASKNRKTSFLGGKQSKGNSIGNSTFGKGVSLGHVLFKADDSQSSNLTRTNSLPKNSKKMLGREIKPLASFNRSSSYTPSSNFWSKVSANRFGKRNRST